MNQPTNDLPVQVTSNGNVFILGRKVEVTTEESLKIADFVYEQNQRMAELAALPDGQEPKVPSEAPANEGATA